MSRFGNHVLAVVALVFTVALGGAQAGVSPSVSKPSIAIKASTAMYPVQNGDLSADLTVTNQSDESLDLCPWNDSCTVHVMGENGEPPTTYRQRNATHRLLPGEAPLNTTLNVGWFVAPGKTDTNHWILKDLYGLSAPGKYTLHFEVQDPKTREVLRSNTVSFSVASPVR